MKLLYDEQHDILDVIFNESENGLDRAGYELRDGIILHISSEQRPVQLTFVNFRRLTELPVVHFQGLESQPSDIRKTLLTLVASPPVNAFLKIDPATFFGHVTSPAVLDVCTP